MKGYISLFDDEYDERYTNSMLGEPGRVMLCLNHDEIAAMQTPIVVEMWDHFGGRNAGGRQRRAYLAEFDEKERKRSGELYRRFYRWYLVSGIPQQVVMSVNTINFVERLVQFAATV